METLGVIEKAAGGIDHDVTSHHQLVSFRNYVNSIDFNAAMTLDIRLKLLWRDDKISDLLVVLSLDGESLEDFPPFRLC